MLIVAAILSMPCMLAAEASCTIATDALQRASDIRSLAIKEQVPCKIRDREGVREYIALAVEKQLPKERLKFEEFSYKLLRLIPEQYDYAQGIIELYLSQIGAYYDPELNHYVMASWLSSETQEDIAIHELTHALQDQHYDLEKFIDHSLYNGDLLLARSALVEGDATMVMLQHSHLRRVHSGIVSEREVNAFTTGGVVDANLRASSGAVPRSLQLMLVFPYSSGVLFAYQVIAEGGFAALAEVYRRPPSSTEEILHYEKYQQGTPDYIVFSEERIRTLAELPDSVQLVYQDTLGEFGIAALLSGHQIKDASAAAAAAGWGGDRVALFVDEAHKQRTVVWVSHWDTERDAEEFYAAYSSVLATEYPGIEDPSLGWRSSKQRRSAKIVRKGSDVVVAIRSE